MHVLSFCAWFYKTGDVSVEGNVCVLYGEN